MAFASVYANCETAIAALDKGSGPRRKATMGSTRIARRAGYSQAASATRTRTTSEADKGERIAGRDAVEQSRHQVRHNQCADKPHGGASKGECESLAQNHV